MMTQQAFMEKFEVMMSDKEIAQQVERVKNIDELQALFQQGGMDLSTDEVTALLAGLRDGEESVEAVDEPLTDDELDMFAGGGFLFSFVGACIGIRASYGFAHGASGESYQAGPVSPIYGIGYNLGKFFRKQAGIKG